MKDKISKISYFYSAIILGTAKLKGWSNQSISQFSQSMS